MPSLFAATMLALFAAVPAPAAPAIPAVSLSTPVAAPARCPGQIAVFNHLMAVVDRPTADAVPHSVLLRRHASLELRTTQAGGAAVWNGRYIYGAQTYLELFGPGDSGDDSPAGSVGLAIGGDRPGVTDAVAANLARAGVAGVTRMTPRTMAGRPVNWFSSVRVRDPLGYAGRPVVKAWSVEFQPDYFTALEGGGASGPAGTPDDVSRRRYLAGKYGGATMAEVRTVHLALDVQSWRHDIAPLLAAAGFCLQETPRGAHIRGGGAEIRIRFVDPGKARLERVDFALSRPMTTAEREDIGHSTLTVGPGRTARWLFR
jgi:hypothetical protein